MRRSVYVAAGATLVMGASIVAAACVPEYAFVTPPADAGHDGTVGPSDAAPTDGATDGTAATDAPSPEGGFVADAFVADAPLDAGVDSGFDAGPPIDAGQVSIAAGTYTFTVEADGGFASRTATVPAFAIDAYEVTVARFAAYVAAGMPAPSGGQSFDPGGPYEAAMTWHGEWQEDVAQKDFADGGMYDCVDPVEYPCRVTYSAGDPNAPIDFVNWFQAVAFCWWDGGKRLPTDTEWQVVATGGTDLKYPWGNTPFPTTCSLATIDYDGGECNFPVPVGSAAMGATANGVFDLQGSVTEWVWDLGGYDEYPDDAGAAYAGPPLDASPGAETEYVYRHARGAGYLDDPSEGTDLSNRALGAAIADSAWGSFGIRCAKSL